MKEVHLLQKALWGGGGGGGGGGPGRLVFLGLRLQPFPLFFLLFLPGGPGRGG